MAPRLVVVGNLTLDDIVHATGQAQMGVAGGDGLYAAIGARIWGSQVAMVSVAGSDWPPEHTRRLQDAGIDMRHLHIAESETLRAWVLYEEDGQRTYVPRNSALVPLRPNMYDDATLTESSIRQFGRAVQDYHVRMSPVPGMVSTLEADALHVCPMRFQTMSAWTTWAAQFPQMLATADMFPLSLREDLETSALATFLSRLAVFLPSMAEARLMQQNAPDLHTLCRGLAAYGPQTIVIKDGRRGSLVFEREADRLRHVPGFPSRLVDSTGAGDSFCGGFLAGITATGDPLEAALWGTVSASFIVEAYGGMHGLAVTPEDAQKRLDTLRRML